MILNLKFSSFFLLTYTVHNKTMLLGFFLETVFFVFEQKKHQPRRNLRSYLVLQRLCNEVALSPGIDAFWY